MTSRIGLISDVHACSAPVEQAMDIFKREKVDKIICPGDIAGYNFELEETIDLLAANHCETIIGNHDQSYLKNDKPEQNSTYPKCSRYLKSLPETLEYNIENKKIYVVHAHPPYSTHGGIKLLDVDGELIEEQRHHWNNELKSFDYDVLLVGHTHQVFAETLGNTFVVNPGSSVYNHSCAIVNLPEMTVDFYGLSGKEILKSWNWGMLVRG